MAQHWSLGDFENERPQILGKKSGNSTKKVSRDDGRLMREASRRMGDGAPSNVQVAPESRVEKAMRRNAPDLVGAPIDEQRAAQMRRSTHLEARWPRPRLIALITTMVLAAVVPTVALRLMIWSLIMFLLAAVGLGPERARDAAKILFSTFLRLWRHEIVVARRLVRKWQ